MNYINQTLKELEKKHLLRSPVTIGRSTGSALLIGRKRFLNFSSNDYLGLSVNKEIAESAHRALDRFGTGSGASRLLSGTLIPHRDLEERIAQFKGTEAALVFSTGYSANIGIIPALAGSDCVIFSDELNHASIIDGIRLSGAVKRVYRHRDPCHLESLLKRSFSSPGSRRTLVITDTVFSMDGDLAPLKDIHFLCRKYNADMIVDDAHGTGVIGRTGRGGLEHFGLNADGVVQMGTMSKALGCMGGYVAGSKELVKFLLNRSRSFIYSTSLPPSVAAAAIKAIEILDKRSDRIRRKLWQNRERLCRELREIGCNTLGSETPIVPVLTGSVKRTLAAGKYLYDRNIFAPAIRPPTVSRGKGRIRLSVTALHTSREIDYLVEQVKGFFDKR